MEEKLPTMHCYVMQRFQKRLDRIPSSCLFFWYNIEHEKDSLIKNKGYLFVHPNLKISSASDMHPMLVCGLANLEVH